MKKIIIAIASVIVLVLLGLFGLNNLKKTGPRERVLSPSGSKLVVEEMSYYIGGEKVFGKVFRPADGEGNPPASEEKMPLLVYFHEPLRTEWPESLMKSLVPNGLTGYTCGYRKSEKEAVALVKRLSKEDFVQDGQVYLISDASCADEIVKATTKLGHKIQGLVLIEPNLTGKARETYVRYGREFLTINSAAKDDAASLIEDYLEERGALK